MNLCRMHGKEIDVMKMTLKKYIERIIANKAPLNEIYTKTFRQQLVKLFKGLISNFRLINPDEEFEGEDVKVLAILLDVNIKLGDAKYSCKNPKFGVLFDEFLSLSGKTIELYQEQDLTFMVYDK